VVLGVLGLFSLVVRFGATLLTFFGAVVLGTALRPGVEWFHRRGCTRRASASLVYLAVAAALVGFVVLLLPLALSQSANAAAALPRWVEQARERLRASSSTVLQRLATELPTLGDPESAASPQMEVTGAQAFAGSRFLGTGAFTVLALLLLGFYWSLEGETAVRTLVRFLPPNRRDLARRIVEEAEDKVGRFVRGQLVVCLVTMALSIVTFTVMGLPNALILAAIAGAMGAVPIFGAPLGFLPAVLVAASVDPLLVPWVVGAGALIHATQDYVVAPHVMSDAVGVHPFVALLAITGFGSLIGVAGALLAVPLAAVVQLLLDRFVFEVRKPQRLLTPRRDRLGVLRLAAQKLALDARRQARRKVEETGEVDDDAEDLVESIADELDQLLDQQTLEVVPPGDFVQPALEPHPLELGERAP
jgi:predicted PurR-regulated permease PerM